MNLNSLDIQDSSTSVTLGGDIAAASTIDVNSGGSIVQSGKITSGTNLDYDAGATIDINDTIDVTGTVDIDSTGVTSIASAGACHSTFALLSGRAPFGVPQSPLHVRQHVFHSCPRNESALPHGVSALTSHLCSLCF